MNFTQVKDKRCCSWEHVWDLEFFVYVSFLKYFPFPEFRGDGCYMLVYFPQFKAFLLAIEP